MSGQSAYRRAIFIVCVALALALAGCGGATPAGTASHGGATSGQPKSAATATAIPVPSLPWRQIHLPDSINLPGNPARNTTGFAISPANGRDMWSCATQNASSWQVLRSVDGGATWRVMSALTPIAPQSQPINGCYLQADDHDVNTLTLMFAWGVGNSPNGPNGDLGYLSTDAGADWARLPGGETVDQVATIGGVTYATVIDTAHNYHEQFVVSQNHLASWQAITPPGYATGPDGEFWAAASGQVLWTALNTGVLWHSSTGGASWAKVPMPSAGSVETNAAIWNAQTGTWLACGDRILATNQPHNQNECTSDLGQTWTAREDLTETWECGHCGPNAEPSSGVTPCTAMMLTADGALLAVCGNDPQDTVTTPTPFNWTLSRLAPGATTWTTIGSVPCTSANLTQTGQLWCVGYQTAIYTLDQLP